MLTINCTQKPVSEPVSGATLSTAATMPSPSDHDAGDR
jgi:hypothetical protein